MTLEDPIRRGSTGRQLTSGIGRKSTKPLASKPISQPGPASLSQKYENVKGINVRIHNLKKAKCLSPFSVILIVNW